MMVKVDVGPELVHGDVDEGYGPVADAFRRNFAAGREVGAACAVYRDGKKVVDLWGGYRDGPDRRPWCEDTIVMMWSTTKGVASLALALAHSRGWLDYDAPVATYWPEFAWRGKQEITVRQLLSHQAGLPVLDMSLSLADLADHDLVAAVVALQRPLWPAGTRHGYHAETLGWYESALLRRIDPGGRSLGRFFAEEIAARLDIDFFIGLPADVDPDRRATLQGRSMWRLALGSSRMPAQLRWAMIRPRSLLRRVGSIPELRGDVAFNRVEALRVEIPAGNGIGEPRAAAAAYGAAVSGGLGLTPATVRALAEPAERPSGGIDDAVLGIPTLFSLGYSKPTTYVPFGGSANAAFGAAGNGGSFAFADPQTGIGYCYAPNRLGFGLIDEREIAVRDALYRDVLGERPQHG